MKTVGGPVLRSIGAVVVVLALVGGTVWLVRHFGPQFTAADVAHARRVGGDSATAEVSRRYLDSLVAPLRDSIAVYKAKPLAAAKIVARHDPVAIRDTATISGTDTTLAVHTVIWPTQSKRGVTVAESTLVEARLPIAVERRLHISIQPDTILAALLQLPDGTQRFAAFAGAHGYAQVVDAAVRPARSRRIRLGCAVGPAIAASLAGSVRAGVGIACGLAW